MKTRTGVLTLTAIAAGLSLFAGTPALRAQESGVQLWGRTCGRCHNARPVNERTDREWATIVNHMRARANLTRSDALAILEFLQAANPSEAGTASRSGSEATEAGEALAGRTVPTPRDRVAPSAQPAAPAVPGPGDPAVLDSARIRELVAVYFRRVIPDVARPW